MEGASLPAGWLLLDPWTFDCARASRVLRKVETDATRHDLLKLIRQRVLQIVAGYEDCNDADTLRRIRCSRPSVISLPESGWPPSRLSPAWQNSVEPVAARPLCALPEEETSQQDHPGSGQYRRPHQEFSFYHGYYRNHILHPLLIFDARESRL